jgi:hypothetical protein
VRLADAVAHHADSLGGAELDDEIKLSELLDRGCRPRFTPAESYRRDGNKEIADERIPAECGARGISH